MRLNSRTLPVGSRTAKVSFKAKGSLAAKVAVLALALVAGTLGVAAQPYSFEQVASGLKHQDPATRLKAIQILKDGDAPEAAAPIGELLGDPDDRVQLAAVDAERSLFTLRPVSKREKVGFIIERRTSAGIPDAGEGQLALKPRPVPPQLMSGIVVALTDRNPKVRGEAIALAAMLAPIACPVQSNAASFSQQCTQVGNALIENINSREGTLRRAAMHALGRLRYPSAVQALLDQLSYHRRGADAEAAVVGLAGTGHVASVSALEELLTHMNATMRRLAVEGLARAGHRDALPQLQQMGQTERSGAVLLALHYATLRLGATGSSHAHIVTSLANESLRSLAIDYLLDLAPLMASTLASSLGDQDVDVRRVMADVLGFSRDPKVIPALTKASKDPDPGVALAAERALQRLKL
jgi:HEAT repeat protein